MKIAVVGTGYVGLVTGSCLAEVGHYVTCIDISQEKVRMLKDAKSPIYEPGIEGLIKRNIDHERLQFTTKLAEALPDSEVVFIAVGTPEGEDGSADLKYVIAVANEIGQLLVKPAVVVVKSTVPVGTCDLVAQTIQKNFDARGVKFTVDVVSNPEFLKEGDAIKDFMKPDRIVVGVSTPASEQTMQRLYAPFITDDPGRLIVMDRRSSELTKYGANAMLATRISFMNEMSRLCEVVGANVDFVRLGMGSDPRIGRKFLYAGPGYGGSCFPKDVAALQKTGEQYQTPMTILNAVSDANKAQKEFVAEKIKKKFGGQLSGKKIAIWGLSFKPGTDDVRDAPAKTVIERLLSWGAEVIGHDPQGQKNFAREVTANPKLTYAEDAYTALKGADALVLLTEWTEYKRPNWQKVAQLMRQKMVFDFRNQYLADELQAQGFSYESVGRVYPKT